MHTSRGAARALPTHALADYAAQLQRAAAVAGKSLAAA
jgi:hypothetical protein